jgi:glycosyltransferase involved in cell wall biosynthesis
MNVVIINDNAQVNGGATKLAILSARDLADQGHQVYFLCAVGPPGPELQNHPRIKVLCTEQFEILTDPSRTRAFAQGWWNPKAQKYARDLFASLDPATTVVQLHLWAKALSSSVIREAVRRGFPIVCTLHDFLLACPTGTLFHHSQGAICHRRPMSLDCIGCNCDTRSYGQKLWRVGRQTIQEQFGSTGRIRHYIAHSQLVASLMKPLLPLDAIIHYIPPYIESAHEPAASPAQHDTFVYLGRLVREKGVVLAARAAKAEGNPITFVGSGEFAAEIAAANPDASITGWVNHQQSVAYLRQARALIFPSLWYETLGLVVLEAAANGIPSIVPDVSAAAEMVIDGVTGLHFKQGDEEDLRRKMRELQDPQLAERLGHAAYDRFWAAPFASRSAHVQSLESVYFSMLERSDTHSHPIRLTNAKEAL